MPKITKELRPGDFIFIKTFNSIGIIERITELSNNDLSLDINHYLRKNMYIHLLSDIEYHKLINKNIERTKYENIEIYHVITQKLKDLKIFDKEHALKLYKIETSLKIDNKRIGQGLIYSCLRGYNPNNIVMYPGIGKNTCRQKYWIEKE